jgi:hypothetical protein
MGHMGVKLKKNLLPKIKILKSDLLLDHN